MIKRLTLIFFLSTNVLGSVAADDKFYFVNGEINPKTKIGPTSLEELSKLIADKQYVSQLKLNQMLDLKNEEVGRRVIRRLIKSIPTHP